MTESVPVLITENVVDKIYFIDYQSLPANAKTQIIRAWNDYRELVLKCKENGYQIVEIGKMLDSIHDSSSIDEKTSEFGEPKK